MRDSVAYLLAQAEKRPLDTVQFAAAEWWRRNRMRWANGIARGIPKFDAAGIEQRLLPFLPGPIWQRSVRLGEAGQGAILSAARRICRHEFEIFGHVFSAGDRIEWHRDYVTGYEWPCALPAELEILRATPGSDVKRPWELARFHQAVTLGQAYVLAPQECFAQEFAQQLLHWAEENPYPRGIHWAMPMEVGIRAINLCVAGALFARAAELTTDFWQKYLHLLFVHGRFLNLHREWNPVARGNHHLGCLVGMQFLGTLFRELPESRPWMAEAMRCIRAEMEWQVGEDGVAHEGSSNYHAFVAEMMLTAGLLGARTQATDQDTPVGAPSIERAWGRAFREKLERMTEFPAALLEGRSAPPVLGDADDGRLLPLCCAEGVSAMEHLVASSRILFDRADWPAPRHDCDGPAWMLDSVCPPAKASHHRQRAFPAGGFYLLESSRLRGSIRCGPLGINGWANHAHCDQLNIELTADGEPVVVDPGTYLYSGDDEARNQFRSSQSHNSPIVDGAEQNRFWPGLLFRMVDDTQSHALLWREGPNAIRFAGMHHAYQRLPQGVTVRRELRLDHSEHSLLVTDHVEGTGSGSVEWWWHFAPSIEPQQCAAGPQAAPFLEAGLALRSQWIAGLAEITVGMPEGTSEFRAEIVDRWYAPKYGTRFPCRCLHISSRARFPLKASFLFSLRSTKPPRSA